jgi:hypothetical protein
MTDLLLKTPLFDTKLTKTPLTGLRVLCSLKVSSSTRDCSLDSRSFFRHASPPPPSSSSLPREHEALSASFSSPFASLSLLFPLKLETVLFGEETPFSSSQSAIDGSRFTSTPPSNGLVSGFRSANVFLREFQRNLPD